MSEPYLEDKDYPVTAQLIPLTKVLTLEPVGYAADGGGQPPAAKSGFMVRALLMLAGQAQASIAKNTKALREGDGLIFTGKLPAQLRPEGSASAEACLLEFNPLFLFDQAGPLIRRYLTPVLESGPELTLDASQPLHSQALEHLRLAVKLHRDKSPGFELAVKGSLCHFWFLLLRLLSAGCATADPIQPESLIPLPGGLKESLSILPWPDKGTAAPEDRERLQNALRFFEAHYAEPVSLDMIAQSVSLSRSECCRCFKRALGITPFEYLQRYRIHMALCKLRDKDTDAETVSGLSASVGFNSSSYFSKTFKQLMGCTPLEYKKRLI